MSQCLRYKARRGVRCVSLMLTPVHKRSCGFWCVFACTNTIECSGGHVVRCSSYLGTLTFSAFVSFATVLRSFALRISTPSVVQDRYAVGERTFKKSESVSAVTTRNPEETWHTFCYTPNSIACRCSIGSTYRYRCPGHARLAHVPFCTFVAVLSCLSISYSIMP